MSVDLFCYTSDGAENANRSIRALHIKNVDLFSKKFLISEPKDIDEIERGIALDYNFLAKSIFLLHLNDKSSADLVTVVVETVKNEFGEGNILMLHNNDIRM